MGHNHGSSTAEMSSMMDEDLFCMGEGRVMLSGFQAAVGSSAFCVKFLFEDAAVDTAAKYAFAVIGVFAMGFANEMLRHARAQHSKSAGKGLVPDLVRAAGFAVQMFLAYCLMLLVMLYEYVFLIFLILGLSTGYFVSLRLTASAVASAREHGDKTPLEADMVTTSGTPCCNSGTVA